MSDRTPEFPDIAPDQAVEMVVWLRSAHREFLERSNREETPFEQGVSVGVRKVIDLLIFQLRIEVKEVR